MCGIAGVVNTESGNAVSPEVVRTMNDVIRHRGPDEDGFYIEGNVGLGMRRLNIIDLVTGSQPIFNEDRTVVTVFNGEIYNYRRLRKELQAKGHRFSTHADTEVIVHLYEEYGEGFLQHLNGMFGVAVWDTRTRTLILARDRLGEKPLHYAVTDDGLAFGSEIKSILTLPGFEKRINREALYHYFTFICVPAPLTIFEGIQKLRPGHYLTFRNGQVATGPYWTVRHDPDFDKSEADFCGELRTLCTESIRDRIISDVPLGAFLSGGIDSTVVVGLMSEVMNEPVKTFSIGFQEDKYNELKYARAVADRFKTEHHEFVVEPNALDLVERIAWHFDEPFGGPSAIPTFIVSELARRFVTVVLTGDGGDEIFGGYDSYPHALSRRRLSHIPRWLKVALARGIGDRLPDTARGKRFLQSLPLAETYHHSVGLSEMTKKRLFSEDFRRELPGLDSYSIVEHNVLDGSAEYLTRFMHLDAMHYLPDNVLVKVDRMSMANSLETRALFLDHEVAELAATMPARMKVNGDVSKYVLKKSMDDLIPESIKNRPKWGFALPVDMWFRGDLKDLITEVVRKSRKTGFFDSAFLEQKLAEHLTGRRNHQRVLWSLMMFDLWYEAVYSGGWSPPN
jgi:asparagine synthase (glutamine-hydrolysing)